MKNLIFAAVLAVCTVSVATTAKDQNTVNGVRQFNVISIQKNQNQPQEIGHGQLQLNYDARKITLNVEIRPDCAKGQMCIQSIRLLRAELSITSIETDSCGIHQVTATEDKRPVDGALQKITVSDVSDMTCKTLVAVEPEATYETEFFDRRSGKTISEKTKMVLAQARDAQATLPVLEYSMTSGFSPQPSRLTVTVDSFGQVKSIRTLLSGSKPEVSFDLASLSADGMKNFRAQLASVAAGNLLIDENEGQPSCLDAGEVEVVVFLHETQVPIYRNSGCHVFKSGESGPSQLSTLALGLATLAR